MDEVVARGINIVAPPMWALVTLEDGRIVPNAYAYVTMAAGLQIITWTLERSGLLLDGGGYYYQVQFCMISREHQISRFYDVDFLTAGLVAFSYS